MCVVDPVRGGGAVRVRRVGWSIWVGESRGWLDWRWWKSAPSELPRGTDQRA